MDKTMEVIVEQIEVEANDDQKIMNFVKLIHLSDEANLVDFSPGFSVTSLLSQLVDHVQDRYDYSSDRGEYPFVGAATWMHDAKDYLHQQRLWG